jgi:hypothetical protein
VERPSAVKLGTADAAQRAFLFMKMKDPYHPIWRWLLREFYHDVRLLVHDLRRGHLFP